MTYSVRGDMRSKRRRFPNSRGSRDEPAELTTFAFIKSLASFLAIAVVVTVAIKLAIFIGR